jgi:hypothetical protein
MYLLTLCYVSFVKLMCLLICVNLLYDMLMHEMTMGMYRLLCWFEFK